MFDPLRLQNQLSFGFDVSAVERVDAAGRWSESCVSESCVDGGGRCG
jgi:hypothetical protein